MKFRLSLRKYNESVRCRFHYEEIILEQILCHCEDFSKIIGLIGKILRQIATAPDYEIRSGTKIELWTLDPEDVPL